MNMKLITAVFVASVSVLAAGAQPAFAAACTPGSNCYCDKVKGGSLNDPNILLCEDFEAPTLRLNQGVGNKAPWFGPMYDDSGQVGNRGLNSYWEQQYNNGVNGVLWASGQPTNPTLGRSCTYNLCVGLRMWHPQDLWGANAYTPPASIMTSNADFSAVVPTLSAPTKAAGGATGVFDGNASMGWTTYPGKVAGIMGTKYWGSRKFTFGVTMAIAYPTNIVTSGITNNPWKSNEWGSSEGDGLLLFHNQTSMGTTFPFKQMFIFGDLGGMWSQVGCNAMLAAATIRKGLFKCNDVAMTYEANSSDYTQSTDWPLGSWACVRGQFTNFSSANVGIKIWVNDILIIDADHLNDSILNSKKGFDAFIWNNYSNMNQGVAADYTTQTTYRYEDNIHVTAGPPVSCAQIGFGSPGPADALSPAKPRGLKLL